MTDFYQRNSLRISEQQGSFELGLENPIFGDKIYSL